MNSVVYIKKTPTSHNIVIKIDFVFLNKNKNILSVVFYRFIESYFIYFILKTKKNIFYFLKFVFIYNIFQN
ncbi:Hypothetical protein GbCGDNIH2_8023 [Granulibacter bethesdensis]|uniref:Uncharacterized protein n=1 Tax=Granulibacter bethesdensis (strain ATCC BAA-1260 / CGDNIH1) TaxID=391165 RepID=A0A286M338_GRABC|nr:Hypothetical protein GbCGDNIH2_8023 [Granulibacter bethesdensis]APH52257.1 Hypothetical protein GbCGDNIH5_8023 [Granulibacter bethesdensis]APH64950.1 Hypothetical protein GbCGDNIH1I4_8023 [Granulibacter bethesdensis]ASV62437.1 Hypothetical protein GbCGDNIH1_8023 [Granulibacter bethesdensis CGDNIH1]